MLVLRLGPRLWQAQFRDAEERSQGSEVKASVWRSIRLEFVYNQSAECGDGLMGSWNF